MAACHGLFFASSLFACSLVAAPQAVFQQVVGSQPRADCQASQEGKSVSVSKVVDGDTVRLTDGSLVRFIGINTPEIDHRYGRSEPFAEAARDQLVNIIGRDKRLHLQPGEEKKDRHGRWLAHVFTPGGVNVQQQLLQQGLAFQIVVPPNLFGLTCYHKAEQQARSQKRGVWSNQQFRAKTIAELGSRERGFRFVTGTIGTIGQSRKSLWLNLQDSEIPGDSGQARSSRLVLRISRVHLHYFRGMNILQWQGRQITARGWISPRKGKQIMTVKHPAALQFFDERLDERPGKRIDK